MNRLNEHLRLAPLWVMTAAICIAPWLFGGVLSRDQTLLLGLLLISVTCWVFNIVTGAKTARLPVQILLLFLVVALGVIQLTPLPNNLVEQLSPKSAEWWATTADQNTEVSPVVSVYPTETKLSLAMLAIPAVTLAITSTHVTTPDRVCAIMGIFALNGALFSLFGIMQMVSFNGKLYWFVPLELGGGPFAAFVNRNHAGAYLNLCFAASLGFLVWVAGRRRTRLNAFDRLQHRHQMFISYLLASICAAGVACTLSRGAAVAFVGAALVVLLAVPHLRNNSVIRNGVVVTALIGVLAAFALGQGRELSERFEGLGEEIHQQSRLQHWQDVSPAIPDYWLLGSGLGTYRYAHRPYLEDYSYGWFFHAENQYLETLVVGGFIGASLLLCLLAAAWWAVFSKAQVQDTAAAQGLAAGCLFALATQTIHAAFDFNQYMPAVSMILAFFVGVVWSSNDSPRKSGILGAPLLVGIVAWNGWALYQTVWATRIASLKREIARIERDEPIHLGVADRYIKRIQDLSPEHPDLLVDRAQLHMDLLRTSLVQGLVDADREIPSDIAWESTSMPALTARHYELREKGQSLSALIEQSTGRDHLAAALKSATSAAQCHPMSDSIRLLVAEYATISGFESYAKEQAEMALKLSPFDPQNLFQLGLREIQAGRMKEANGYWKQCLELSTQFSEQIVRSSLGRLSSREFVDELMPTDPKRALHIVKRYFDDPRQVEIRSLLAQHLKALDDGPLGPPQKAYLESTIYSLEGNLEDSIASLKEAVKAAPDLTRWRHELALHLQRLNMLAEARQHLLVCVQLAPGNKVYAQALVSLEARINSQKY